MAQVRTNIFDDGNVWTDFLKMAGYVPVLSSFTGMTRVGIGVIGAALNALCIPIFTAMPEAGDSKEALENLNKSTLWVIRGLIESEPFIGNAVVWSLDALDERKLGKGYRSGILHACRFVPFVSIVTGVLRSARGVSGVAIGVFSEFFYRSVQAVSKKIALQMDAAAKIQTCHKYIQESLYEIPQGLIEVVPVCDSICPALARVADIIEDKKIKLWTDVRHEQ